MGFIVDNTLRRVDTTGGPPETLADVPGAAIRSGSWNRQGHIVLGSWGGGSGGPLWRLSSGGGAATALTEVDLPKGEFVHTSPTFLPDGEHFLYFRSGPPEVEGMYVGSLDVEAADQSRQRILATDVPAVFANGYLFYLRAGTLMAQPFDADRLALQDVPPVPLAENVGTTWYFTGQFSVAGVAGSMHGEDRMKSAVEDGTATIIREVQSLKSMVDEFSRFARLPNAKLESGDVNEVVRQVLPLYTDRVDDVVIESELADDLPPAMIDAEQVKRVFVNLIDNAVEAFDLEQPEKIVTVRTRYDSARDLIVSEIVDNGRGIAPSDLQKLFQPYFSTKGRGTGLGLAIVHRIVTEHNGKIRAVANQPRGARFIVELPVAA